MLVKAYASKDYVRFEDVPIESADVVCVSLHKRTAQVAVTFPDTTTFDHYTVTRETAAAIVKALEGRQEWELGRLSICAHVIEEE